MIYTIRLCILILILGWVSHAAFAEEEAEEWGTEETLSFRYHMADDPAEHEGVEVLVYRPDDTVDKHFFLYLEASNDLKNWEVEALPNSAIDEDGLIIVDGIANKKFWRLRIRAALRDDEDWPTVLKMHRDERRVWAELAVVTDYYPAVRHMVEAARDTPVPWGNLEAADEEAVHAASTAALTRLLEIVEAMEPRRGDALTIERELTGR